MSEIRLYKALRGKLGDIEAQELVGFIKSEINSEFMDCKQVFLTKEDKLELLRAIKEDKVDIMRSIYIVGLVQFLTIIGALIGIVSFFLKH